MLKESRSCCHTTTRSINKYAYERNTDDWVKIPTIVEDMKSNLGAPLVNGTRLRTNDTVSGMIPDMVCMIDIAMAYEGTDIVVGVVVLDNVESGRYMGVVKMMFDIMKVLSVAYSSTTMHMSVSSGLYLPASVTVVDNPSVYVYDSNDLYKL
ncbi:hypothetical protein SCAR479_11656 [Seiridium cardinale]|uniref:Uncharacterized protein n=1 Tax=Seiridium cardinale TaxID=138064 RepID=A0ABR2XDJ5_9PEZI